MQKSLLIIVLCFSFEVSTSQGGLDSLKISYGQLISKTATYKRDSSIVRLMNGILAFTPLNQHSEYKLWTDSLRKFSLKSKYPDAIFFYFFNSAIGHGRGGMLNLSFSELEKAVAGFKKSGNMQFYLRSQNLISVIIASNLLNNPIQSPSIRAKYLLYLEEGLNLAKSRSDTLIASSCHVNLGLFYFTDKKYDLAYKNYGESKRLVEKKYLAGGKQQQLYFYNYFGGIWAQGLCLLYMNRAEEGFKLVNYVASVCSQERKDGLNKYLMSVIGIFLGNYYLEKNDYKSALTKALMGEKAINDIKLTLLSPAINKILYKAYRELNQPAKALLYFEKLENYNQEQEKNKFNENYTEWQLKYADEKQKTQIKILENEKLKRANERKDLMRNILIISSIFGVFITIYVLRNNKELKIKNEELIQKNDEILGAMSKGQSIERKRLASELHDNLNTKLVALKWRIEALDRSSYPLSDQKILDDFTRVLDDIYMDVRLISHNLLPAELETLGLAAALQKLINSISNQHVTFNFLSEGVEERFDTRLEHELYNITLELINNILKHAQATQAWVSLTMQNDKISLTVSDNGKGIDLNKFSDGVGLRNVHSRVEGLNGKLQITNGRHSTENAKGTNVQVDLTI